MGLLPFFKQKAPRFYLRTSGNGPKSWNRSACLSSLRNLTPKSSLYPLTPYQLPHKTTLLLQEEPECNRLEVSKVQVLTRDSQLKPRALMHQRAARHCLLICNSLQLLK